MRLKRVLGAKPDQTRAPMPRSAVKCDWRRQRGSILLSPVHQMRPSSYTRFYTTYTRESANRCNMSVYRGDKWLLNIDMSDMPLGYELQRPPE